MKQNLLLLYSSGIYLIAGVGALFAPGELLALGGVDATGVALSLMQILGAALVGFAGLNWANRYAVIGGILGRPVVSPNFTHTFIAAAVLSRTLLQDGGSALAWVALATYATLALLFGIKMFGPTPTSIQAPSQPGPAG